MASIVSSTIASQVVQRDGRISVDEVHVDNWNAIWQIGKLAPSGTDLNAMLAADGQDLLARLQTDEIEANYLQVETFGSLAVTTLNYSTANQGAAVVRERYKTATHTQAVMIGDFFNTLTDVQLQNLFNMTPTQVTNLRTNKLAPAAQTAADIRASSGA